jgi:hypothetical protein
LIKKFETLCRNYSDFHQISQKLINFNSKCKNYQKTVGQNFIFLAHSVAKFIFYVFFSHYGPKIWVNYCKSPEKSPLWGNLPYSIALMKAVSYVRSTDAP